MSPSSRESARHPRPVRLSAHSRPAPTLYARPGRAPLAARSPALPLPRAPPPATASLSLKYPRMCQKSPNAPQSRSANSVSSCSRKHWRAALRLSYSVSNRSSHAPWCSLLSSGSASLASARNHRRAGAGPPRPPRFPLTSPGRTAGWARASGNAPALPGRLRCD